jgi:hypothetical protein
LTAMETDHKRLEAAEQWESRGVNYLDELFDMSDRMPPADALRVSKFTGTAMRVDKNGKQSEQALFILATGARTPNAASELMSAIDRDNLRGRKFYLGTSRTVGGTDSHTNTHNQLATITTKVMHRAPSEYSRDPLFYVPRRGGIVVAPPEPAKETPKGSAAPGAADDE